MTVINFCILWYVYPESNPNMDEGFLKLSDSVTKDFPGIEVYNLKVSKLRGDYYIQIELDNLLDPYGAVSLNVCEHFSKRFIEVLDEEILNQKNTLLPVDLKTDNYTLEVSSAGAERELRLPRDIERFKKFPMRVIYKTYREDTNEEIEYDKILLYVREEDENYVFTDYLPRKERLKKKGIKKGKPLSIPKKNIVKINLYLDI